MKRCNSPELLSDFSSEEASSCEWHDDAVVIDVPEHIFRMIARYFDFFEYFDCQRVCTEWRDRFQLDVIWQDLCVKMNRDRLHEVQRHTPPRIWSRQFPRGIEEPVLPSHLSTWKAYVPILYDHYNGVVNVHSRCLSYLDHYFLSLQGQHHRLRAFFLTFCDSGAITSFNVYAPETASTENGKSTGMQAERIVFCAVFYYC
jgi:hypothetical protein